jgi:hypothetical protein
MDHKQYMQTVKEYRQRSGHSINYYDGGYSVPGSPYTGERKVQKGSLAKDKMNNILSKSDSKSNQSSKRKNVVGEINDL